MENGKTIAFGEIERQQPLLTEISDKIWSFAELSLCEHKSAALYREVLRSLGFSVTDTVAGMETAFMGSFGQGRPVIGILAEYDALSGLSQQGCVSEPHPLTAGGAGHGCGHHLLGAGALAAAIGIKAYLAETGKPGTVILFGTPGEEGGAGKAFMAKQELWRTLDAALTWHPNDTNEVSTGSCNSCLQYLYRFQGTPAHAAGDPEDGRSALDAVELMNIGVQYLREHMKSGARIHYSMIDGGGRSPNVVQATASVLYMIRSELCRDAIALAERVDKIASGAAMMTETRCEKVFIDGCSNTVSNHALEALAYENLCALGAPAYTDAEWAYARALKATYPDRGKLPSIAAAHDDSAKAAVARLSENGSRALNDFIAPRYAGAAFSVGSTDVGDVSWQTPAVQIHTVTYPSGAPGHSWQNVACGVSTIAHKGMLLAGKALAATAIDLFEQPALLASARAEFELATASGYVCPIPDGAVPRTVDD